MLTLPAPTPLNGDLLAQQLASAGLVTTVALNGDVVELAGLIEANRTAAQQILAAHPASAQAEIARRQGEATNETTIRDRVTKALKDNATFIGLTSPTNAQVAAQVKALTRQNQGLIRLLLQQFDGTD